MNGWSITTVSAAGTLSSQATVISRDSAWMIIKANVDGGTDNISVQLPTSPVVGDVVEVCVASTANSQAYVWYATTVGSSLYLWEEVGPGKCRLYRYVSGPSWNRFS